jgi:hypothetical protein
VAANFDAMTNWFTDFHHVPQLHLLSLVLVLGVLGPGLGLLVMAGRAIGRHAAERVTPLGRVASERPS